LFSHQKAGGLRLSQAHALNARAFSRDSAMLQESRPRVLLADDHVDVLSAVQRMLEPSCEIVGCVTSGSAALEEAKRLQPDVVVLDVAMPQLNGLDVCRQIKAAMPEIRIVVLTASNDPEIRKMAFNVGASGFVIKHYMANELLPAVRKAFFGDALAEQA
jgi:DNA-binding NarL/FixJ family response regulator